MFTGLFLLSPQFWHFSSSPGASYDSSWGRSSASATSAGNHISLTDHRLSSCSSMLKLTMMSMPVSSSVKGIITFALGLISSYFTKEPVEGQPLTIYIACISLSDHLDGSKVRISFIDNVVGHPHQQLHLRSLYSQFERQTMHLQGSYVCR